MNYMTTHGLFGGLILLERHAHESVPENEVQSLPEFSPATRLRAKGKGKPSQNQAVWLMLGFGLQTTLPGEVTQGQSKAWGFGA